MPEKFEYDGVEYKLPTSNGLVFESHAAAYQLICRSQVPIWDHGVRIGEERELVADFGDMDQAAVHDEDTGADYYPIRGHFCNTLEQGRRKNWTPDERTIVEKKLLAYQNPGLHWLHTTPPAQKPWPSYDETDAKKIPALAVELGLVAEATAYEQQNANRKAVLDGLASSAVETETAEELVAQ